MPKQLAIVLLSALLMLVTGCEKSTQSETGSLTGYIELFDETDLPSNVIDDFSGVSIALYGLAKLDTTLVRVIQQYPSIGIPITQETEFDHRFHNPILITTTNESGLFELKNIPPGVYNLIALKDGWGCRYVYNLSIDKGSNALPSSISSNRIRLFKETTISGAIFSHVVFLPYHHYIIEEDVYFMEGSSINIHSGSVIRINPAKSLFITQGVVSVIRDHDYFKVTSNDKYLTSTKVDSVQPYYSFRIHSGASVTGNQISRGVISHGMFTFQVETRGLRIFDMRIASQHSGLLVNNSSNISDFNTELHNNVITDVRGDGSSALILYQIHNAEILRNVLINNLNGIDIREVTQAVVSNNYFCNGNIDIVNRSRSSTSVSHNLFLSPKSIENSWGSYVICQNNVFISDTGINNIFVSGSTGLPFWSFITANDNNFYCSRYAVVTRARFVTSEIIEMNVQQNYWNTTDSAEIMSLIWDLNDEDITHPHYDQLKAIFRFIPFRNSKVSIAGIQ